MSGHVSGERQTFVIPDGFRIKKDADGRALGIEPIPAPTTEEAMNALAYAISLEVHYQQLRSRGSWPISRAWCAGSVAFLVGARDAIAASGPAKSEGDALLKPQYWKRRCRHGVQYAVMQLHFPSRAAGMQWVACHHPDELAEAEAGWSDDAPSFDHNIWADIPPTSEAVAVKRHRCASSGPCSDMDGCTCSDAELARRSDPPAPTSVAVDAREEWRTEILRLVQYHVTDDDDRTTLMAAIARLKGAAFPTRGEVLEEAAKTAEDFGLDYQEPGLIAVADEIAAAIRALNGVTK